MQHEIIIGTLEPNETMPPIEDFLTDEGKVVTWIYKRQYIVTDAGRIRLAFKQRIALNYGDEPGIVVLNESRSFYLTSDWLKANHKGLYEFWRARR
jgi:hypothetical protein